MSDQGTTDTEGNSTGEPVAVGGAVIGLGAAILAVLVGSHTIDADASASLLGVLTAAVGLVTVIVRHKVKPL